MRELEKATTKELVIDFINDKMDLPKLTEDEEAKLIQSVYDAAVDAISTVLERL